MAVKIPTPLQTPSPGKRKRAQKPKSPGRIGKPAGANTVMARHARAYSEG